MKHDAHVLKFKMQFFPVKLFFLSIFAFFLIGLWIGHIWGFYSCYKFNFLLD